METSSTMTYRYRLVIGVLAIPRTCLGDPRRSFDLVAKLSLKGCVKYRMLLSQMRLVGRDVSREGG